MSARYSVWDLLLLFAFFAGCTVSPAPIPIHDEPTLLVDIAHDPHAGSGHTHPVRISPEQMNAILKGILLHGRDVTGTYGLFKDGEGTRAFSDREAAQLAPLLAAGLGKSSPNDLVRFRLIQPDKQRTPLITSGGIFQRNRHVYVLLANAKTSLFTVQYENVYEPSVQLDPLLPIVRFKFITSFLPNDWSIATHEAKKMDAWEGYLDESKVVVVDLAQIPKAGVGEVPDKPTP